MRSSENLQKGAITCPLKTTGRICPLFKIRILNFSVNSPRRSAWKEIGITLKKLNQI